MKNKIVTNEKDYKVKTLLRAITICWCLLALCAVIKLFCSDFFEIVCKNESFISFCNYIDNNIWSRLVIYLISGSITNGLFLLAILEKPFFNKKELILLIITIIIGSVVKLFSVVGGLIIDVWQFFILPLIMKGNWKRIIVANIFNVVFQAVSMFIRNISLSKILPNESMLIALIFAIDVYIMLGLYYLYTLLKKEKEKMGWWLGGLFANDLATLKTMKLEIETKIENCKDIKEIKALTNQLCDIIKVIAEKEAEEINDEEVK